MSQASSQSTTGFAANGAPVTYAATNKFTPWIIGGVLVAAVVAFYLWKKGKK
ncbi:MAG: hypothetical protein ACXWIU_02285 [Limisphaerales bacterium]